MNITTMLGYNASWQGPMGDISSTLASIGVQGRANRGTGQEICVMESQIHPIIWQRMGKWFINATVQGFSKKNKILYAINRISIYVTDLGYYTGQFWSG